MNPPEYLEPAVARVMEWTDAIVAMLPNLALAIGIVVVFGLLARAVRSVSKNLFGRLTDNNQLVSLGAAIARIAVIIVGVFLALSVLHLDKTVTSILAGLGVAGVALGFAFQDIASNFMSGLMMAVRHPFKIGDYIKSEGFEGTVEHMDLRSTTLITVDGVNVTLPNSQVFGNPILNYTEQAPRRVEVLVGVGYEDDLNQVERICHDVAKQMDNLLDDKPIQVFFTEFGGSSINLSLRYWTDNSRPGGWLRSRSNAIKAIHKRFAEEGINIPYPIRTLDMPKEHLAGLNDIMPQMRRNDRRDNGHEEELLNK